MPRPAATATMAVTLHDRNYMSKNQESKGYTVLALQRRSAPRRPGDCHVTGMPLAGAEHQHRTSTGQMQGMSGGHCAQDMGQRGAITTP